MLKYQKNTGLILEFDTLISPAGFWPRGQNPRRHPRVPRVYLKTCKEFQESKKCVLDLMKLGGLG